MESRSLYQCLSSSPALNERHGKIGESEAKHCERRRKDGDRKEREKRGTGSRGASARERGGAMAGGEE